ncbi:MAG: ATP-binding protein, partial [Oscillospiraceae bacterium]
LSFAVITGVLYNNFSEVQKSQLESHLSLLEKSVESYGKDSLTNITDGDYRITWIASDGAVLYDTKADESVMENHLDREEISEAFTTGKGESSRYSDTLTEKTIYYAHRLSDGTVLRISESADTIWALIFDVVPVFVLVFGAAVVVSAVLAQVISKRIVQPINQLDLDNPTTNDCYDELSPLLTKINKQHKEIEANIAQIKKKSDEFEQIIAAVNEGLVLMNKDGKIISINNAAISIFEADGNAVGENFLQLNHSLAFQQAIEKALEGGNSCFDMDKGGRKFRININSIKSGEETLGAVVLAFDVTEQANAEKARQEFTANVSHELKTPLQTIIGSAELFQNGLVKPEDTDRFIGHIKKEAERLVTLVNDIIHLSQLDEGSAAQKEKVEVFEIAQNAVSLLKDEADSRKVTIELTGENVEILGVRQYLHEIIYNLCDNAIRYNKENGKVAINVKGKENKAVITVSDTGIGIPEEHQSRIFERFYRVDKSHSKETGGTGLGLSIVKHAVAAHGGNISLESTAGEGTTIRVEV